MVKLKRGRVQQKSKRANVITETNQKKEKKSKKLESAAFFSRSKHGCNGSRYQYRLYSIAYKW